MKITLSKLPLFLAVLAAAAFNSQISVAHAQGAASPARNQISSARPAIPFDQIGAVAGKQYAGDGLAVMSSPDGATLRCTFQRLDAHATREGLWLTSTKDGSKGEPFRIVAQAIGREKTQNLSLSGEVKVNNQTAQFIRPGVIEEYSVGIDGLQQDFVVEQRPDGQGPLRMELKVDGAKAEAMRGGARLVLDDGQRNMAYNRLRAVDARGRELTAQLQVLSPNRLAVILDDAAAEYPVRIDPTFSDANWTTFGNELPGVAGTVYAEASDNAGNIYVGGQFTAAGNVLANNVAKWNGTSWSALGSGIGPDSEGSSIVYALAVSGTNLYTGGFFGTAGGIAATNLAEWNGHSWSALGTDIPYISTYYYSQVSALAVSGGNLYVGGNFTSAGGVPVNYIAQWNGSSWSALSSGLNGYVYALAVSGNVLYAGGYFTSAGGVAATNIAEWNGSSWSALGLGLNSEVEALAVSGNVLYAGGSFTTAGGVSATNIAVWNGSSWSAMGSGMSASLFSGSYVSAIAVSGGNLYAGGNFIAAGGVSATNIAEWNGNAWSAIGSGANSGVNALVVLGTNLYVGGGFTSVDGVSAEAIAQWNGNLWSGVGSGVNSWVYALAVSGNNLYAGGYFTMAGSVPASCVAEWNGSSWSALGSGIPENFFIPVLALAASGTNLFVAGKFTTAGGVAATNIAEWNGSSWSAVGPGLNSQVAALAVSGTNLYAGGYFTAAGGVSATNIAQWNGSSWSTLGLGMYGGFGGATFVQSLAVSGTNLYAGGSFTTAGGVAANNIAEWNGSSWSALGSGVNGADATVYTLAVLGANLVAGGYFATAGSVPASSIAQWNGSSWSALSSGVNGTVYAMAGSGGNLFAAGQFTTAGGTSATNIAEWNGASWFALGPGINGQVEALAASGGSLFAGGLFTSVGATPVGYIAQWSANSWSSLGSGSGFNGLVRAMAVSDDNLYVGGYFTSVPGGSAANYVARWDGTFWWPLGSGMNGEVNALATSAGNLFAGGDFTTAGGISASNIAEWNGSSWSPLGSGVNGGVNALALSGTNVFAGGFFNEAGGVSTVNVAEWNGSSWSALGSGIGNYGTVGSLLIPIPVSTLMVSGTNLYAGLSNFAGVDVWNGSSWSSLGSFNDEGIGGIYAFAILGTNLYAGGYINGGVQEWNGSSWTQLGSGVDSEVIALAVSQNHLFAGGSFSINGTPVNIAEWDGASWWPLGSGITGGFVYSLAVLGNNLFAGGNFATAGTNVSANFAEANIAPPTITSGPAGVTLPIGDTANFGVSATGSLGLGYQWYFNTNNALPGGTNANLAVSSAITNDDGYYQVVVNNLFGSATSDVAFLSVIVEPNMAGISNNPSGGTTTLSMGSYPGSTNYLYATTDLLLPLSQWQLVASNVAPSDGLFQFVDTHTQGVPARFYLLSTRFITPAISIGSISPIAAEQNQTITISGSGFGTQSPYNGDSDYIYVLDVTGNWEAGYQPAGNYVTLNVTSWTDNQIVISGFTGYYGYGPPFNWFLEPGDNLTIAVWNPQTGIGPAMYYVTVGSP